MVQESFNNTPYNNVIIWRKDAIYFNNGIKRTAKAIQVALGSNYNVTDHCEKCFKVVRHVHNNS